MSLADLIVHLIRGTKLFGRRSHNKDAAGDAGGTSDRDVNSIGWSPIMSAAFRGDIAELGLLFDGSSDIDAITAAGQSALMVAAICGQDRAVRYLVDRGAAQQPTIEYLGYTALIFAVGTCNVETVRHLIDTGAKVNQTTWHTVTALKMARRLARQEMVDLLHESGAKDTTTTYDRNIDIFTVPIAVPAIPIRNPQEALLDSWRNEPEKYTIVFPQHMALLLLEIHERNRYFGISVTPFSEIVELDFEHIDEPVLYDTQKYSVVSLLLEARPYRVYEVARGVELAVKPGLYSDYLRTIFEMVEAGVPCRNDPPPKEVRKGYSEWYPLETTAES